MVSFVPSKSAWFQVASLMIVTDVAVLRIWQACLLLVCIAILMARCVIAIMHVTSASSCVAAKLGARVGRLIRVSA